MRKLLMLIAVVLPGLFGGTVYARPSAQAWHLRTDTVTSLAAQELLRRLPPFVYNDTAPAQPMSLLIPAIVSQYLALAYRHCLELGATAGAAFPGRADEPALALALGTAGTPPAFCGSA